MTTEIQRVPTGMEPAHPTGMQLLADLSHSISDPQAAVAIANAIVDLQVKMQEHQWRVDQRQDEMNFNAALKRIQKQLKPILKRGDNPETHSKFAKIEDIDNEIQSLLDSESMTLTFIPAESKNAEEVVIVGVLSLGAYKREYPLPMPADGKGPKGGNVMTRTHATGSAIAYAKRYLKNMIFDLRFRENDDDGNAAGGQKMKDLDLCLKDLKSAKTIPDAKAIWHKGIAAAKEAKDATAIGKIHLAFGEANTRISGEAK